MHDLNNEVALVTGASRGIGRAIALALGGAGATVVGTATSDRGAQAISATLAEAGIAGRGIKLDVASDDSVEQALADISAAEGAVTLLVNNAGITRDGLLLRMKIEDWQQVIDTDLTGIYRTSRACLRGMMKARRGRIVNIGSVVGLMGNPGQANYCAAKAGLVGFTRSLAREVGSRGITVNAVAPGFIATDMTATLSAEQRSALEKQIPLERLGAVEDIAQTVLFLCSAGASYITGEVINVNGGMYMA
ncbi:3-oxoacyl-ACP reductase FabG [Thioalkalivibrio sp. XN279]|uniref:3-oxoacyl-ACP reductase FabG n=1 Tax=Thioalkalivibrio sp. XN279 TaxID=2714953 RepID=UPI00140D5073|nr:3-oxoacyl-ACP reductase FabG [Thioalkalivibrio sp. XN279]NHA14458.1 3-oxoacyl-ACP reductase FabG [Thioalkalivibrio sp. XN279]